MMDDSISRQWADVPDTNVGDTIYRQAAIDALGIEPFAFSEYENGLHDKWENDVEALTNLPSAQPDLSDYSDKLWKIAYERGKREAQPERKNCETCRYNNLNWDEEPCDSCTGDHWKPERKTGKWIKSNNSCTIRCNQCGQEMTSLCDIQLPNYCLNCGANMRGKKDDI